jgi:hypothetical protein
MFNWVVTHSFILVGDAFVVLVMTLLLLLVFYILKNAYLGFLCFWQNLFIYGKMRAMARQLFRAYLLAPYRFHLSRNTAVLQRNINTDVPQMFNWVVTHSFILVGDAFVVLVMTLLLLAAGGPTGSASRSRGSSAR